MDCPNWPPPLPSLPLYPPCSPAQPPLQPEVQLKESQIQEWWNQYLGPSLTRVSGYKGFKKGITYELTRRQRRELLVMKTKTREDKLIWSVPLPEGSYPRNGLPIWERLYLDRKLPILKSPPDALVFARQKIGKKLWKDTEGQEFILFDPHSYEVKFSYENVHDPHLKNYYKGKAIKGFLLNLGDATADEWGLCSLKKFNEYRMYLRRVHLSLVHSKMKKQEALSTEIHQMNEYKQLIEKIMADLERKTMLEEMRAAIVEALKQERINRINRLIANIQAKEGRIRKLYRKRARDKEERRKRGLKLLAQRELKKKIAQEIQRRRKITTLRMWHDKEERMLKKKKEINDERARQTAEKVRTTWQNKIHNLRKMFDREEECLKLQEKVRAENIEIRKAIMEREKQKEKDRFQDIRKENLRKKALIKRHREDRRMEKAITETWFRLNPRDYDSATEIYRVKKSITSTMAEFLSSHMQGPDRLSIILLSRYRIQREQRIPIQVSFAIDAILETTIQKWAKTRLLLILDVVTAQVKENGRKELERIKDRYKDFGPNFTGVFKATDPRGSIYQHDPKPKKPSKKKIAKKPSVEQTLESTTNDLQSQDEKSEREIEKSQESESEKEISQENKNIQATTAAVPNYVHYGPVSSHEYPIEFEPKGKLKSVAGRPKTPMPTQEVLCQAGFLEEKLNDILPTFLEDVMDLKEKRKFRKMFKNVAIQLFSRSIAVTKVAFEPLTRVRAVNKLVYLGDTDKQTLTNTLCSLIMNYEEKALYQTQDFDWLSRAMARKVIKEILNPPVLCKEPEDGVARTKIMFYAPKQRIKKS